MARQALDYSLEAGYATRGYEFVIGLDGVGLGCIFGPVTVGWAIFRVGDRLEGIYDSKAMTPKARVTAVPAIRELAVACGVVELPHTDYNELGPRQCELEGFRRAWTGGIRAVVTNPRNHVAVLDGTYDLMDLSRLDPWVCSTKVAMPKGDAKVLAVAAASILAKTDRDAKITALAEQYPGYDLASNMGYASPRHIKAIGEQGVTPLHRYTAKNFVSVG